MTTTCRPLLLLSLRLLSAGLARAQDGDDEGGGGGASDDDLAWIQAFSGLGPYLIGIFFVVFSLHVYLYPKHAERSLLQDEYIDTGARISGHALSCEYKEGSGGDAFLVEVVYPAKEHKYADNPSLKFRNPTAYEDKRFLRRFEFGREVGRGEEIEVLIPDPERSARSGLPTEVVDRMLAGHAAASSLYKLVLGTGVAAVVVLLGFAIREVTAMENPGAGWIALLAGLGVIEAAAFLYSADQFFKSKRRRFDSARPMIASSELEALHRAMEENRGKEKLDVPFRISHEFAGHARASERQV